MITYHPGQNIFDSEADAWVNPVNCVGVMGAGLAEMFKQRFPEMFNHYRKDCLSHRMRIGRCHVYRLAEGVPRYIINLPTKFHWRDNSELHQIDAGLHHLRDIIKTRAIRSIAIPMLGCGLGGLGWAEVRPLILSKIEDLDCDIEIYGPGPEEATG